MFTENKKWFKTAKKLYRKNKLEQPYASLFNYYVSMTLSSPMWKKATLYHYVYFKNHEKAKTLNETINNLNSILPPALQENFNIALKKFNNLKDAEDVEYVDIFEEEDDFVDDNADVIENMLKNYINDF